MKPIVTAVIQARVGSTRLPGKILKPLAGEPLLSRVVERTRRISRVDKIILAIPNTKANKSLKDLGKKMKVDVVEGAEEDVLKRYVQAGTASNAEHILRITSDNPLTDPNLADLMLDRHLNEDSDYTIPVDSIPIGVSSEVVKFHTLKYIAQIATETRYREHVTTFFHDHAEDFRINRISVPDYMEGKSFRLTVDTKEDLILMEHLYDLFHKPGSIIDLKEVISWLETHPKVAQMNCKVNQKNWRSEK